MDQDSYKNLKQEIIKFANQRSVRKQLREQIDRLCEMVEKRKEIIRPIIYEAFKRHTDLEIRKQAVQKQVDKLKNLIKKYDKPLPNGQAQAIEVIDKAYVKKHLLRRPNGTISGILDLPKVNMQDIYRFLVDEWDKIEKYWGKKKNTQEMAEKIADYNYMRDRLSPMAMVYVSDLLKEEGTPGDGYLFGYEYDYFCKEPAEGCGWAYWYPSEPPNPIEWFPFFSVCGGELKFRHMEPDEEFMVNAVILASMYDEEMSKLNPYSSQSIYSNEPYTGQYFDRDKFLRRLWWHFRNPDLEKQTRLELALQNVRDESKTELTGGNNSVKPVEKGQKKKKRGANVRNDHVKEAYDALGNSPTTKAQHLANWINNKYGKEFWKMKEGNVMKSQPWKKHHPKKK